MSELEVGKTYVFKDESCAEEYLNNKIQNKGYFQEYYWGGFKINRGWNNCGFINGLLMIASDELKYFKLKEENVMPISSEDEVTITTTYRELARVYAILGKVDGAAFSSLFNQVAAMLDPDYKKYSKFISPIDKRDVLNYHSYQFSWEALLFSEQETPQQIQIREQAEALLQKAKELEGTK